MQNELNRHETQVQLELVRSEMSEIVKKMGAHIGKLYGAFEKLAAAIEATDARLSEVEQKFPKMKSPDSSVEL